MAKLKWWMIDVKDERTEKGINITFRMHPIYKMWLYTKIFIIYLILRYTWMNELDGFSIGNE